MTVEYLVISGIDWGGEGKTVAYFDSLKKALDYIKEEEPPFHILYKATELTEYEN